MYLINFGVWVVKIGVLEWE